MVAAQTAEQKAEAEKAAAEKQAAEQKAAEEKAAAEKAKAESDAAAASTAADEAPAKSTARYTVTGAVAVIRTKDGSERYMYRGAPIDPEAFDADSIKHVVGLGLVTDAKAKAKK